MIVKHGSLILLLNCIPFVTLRDYQKPVAEKLWRQRCIRNSLVLNDCNWCWCSENFRYTCDARVCGKVDMFGHFKDAIQDINVGMEGHGVWRTTAAACEPGVHYNRGDLLCVCTEDGTWPNPVCRDTFRVLHTVEVIKNFKLSRTQQCSPNKLYLADCNVCFCPSSGYIDPSLCTQKMCTKNNLTPTRTTGKELEEVYAQCYMEKKYKLGCKTCVCLKNNRLLCDKCTSTTDSHCVGKNPGENFHVDCNTCHCDDKGTIYCTVNKCLDSQEEVKILKHTDVQSLIARRPLDDIDCEPGTRFKKDCNICYCFQTRGKIKKYGCTVKQCHGEDSREECKIGDRFSKPCQTCHCGIINDQKMEICKTDPKCVQIYDSALRHSGYSVKQNCKPMQEYQNGCNTCLCLPDGETITCTDEPCESKSISLDIIPVAQKIPDCPKGHSYRIDCNYCFCLADGIALCTTMDCTTQKNK